MRLIRMGALSMFLAVLLGAFGAHGLKERMDEYGLDVYRTAVLYQMIHSLGIFVVAWVSEFYKDENLRWAAYSFAIGIALFSGSLYLLAVTRVSWLGSVTPIGGMFLLMGWLHLFMTFKRKS